VKACGVVTGHGAKRNPFIEANSAFAAPYAENLFSQFDEFRELSVSRRRNSSIRC
jgi:hypothetical protein